MITRRKFMQQSALLTGAATLSPRMLAGNIAASTKLNPVTHDQVRIAGPLRAQLDQAIGVVLQLDDDAMLHPYRAMESLPAPGVSLAGWYARDGFAPGHCFGQWMSALARYSAAYDDAAAREKLDRMVALHSATILPDGKFFSDNHFPAYTYDKLLRGLMDAHLLTGNVQALDSMQRLQAAVTPSLPAHSMSRAEFCALKDSGRDTGHALCWDEQYTLPENQFLAYKMTRDPHYLDRARRMLVDQQFFFPLAQGENKLIGQHAYSHCNTLSSGVQAYLELGDPRYLAAVTNGWRMIQQQSYATGGWGPDEEFFDPSTDRAAESLEKTHHTFETPCGSYGHLKLARYLLQITGDPAYGDSMERVLYNTVAGALPLQPDGRAFYYSDYNRSASKFYHDDRWPCCAGTLPMVASDYGISSYFRDAQGVTVNLYVPSTLRFTSSNGTRIALTQSGGYPASPEVLLRVETSRPAKFAVRLRIPSWTRNAEIRINGKPAEVAADPGTFASIAREWRTGDRIELTLPLPMRTEPLNAKHPELDALLRGPVCLFAIGDTPASSPITHQQLLTAQAVSASNQEFQMGTQRFKPFTALAKDEKYSLYLKTS